MTGNTVLQRFEITERLGAGGFGTVYRAWDNRLERDVAVKVIETGAGSGERVQREAQAAARLNHPGIVTLFEYDFQKGRAYLVSELVEGSTVRQLIDCDGLSDRDIAEVGADVCEALDHAHSRGVVHRDLKPANLIVERRGGAAKLMDFGIARLTDADDLTMTGDVLDTLAYRPRAARSALRGTSTRSASPSMKPGAGRIPAAVPRRPRPRAPSTSSSLRCSSTGPTCRRS